jgi:hypothetical protein
MVARPLTRRWYQFSLRSLLAVILLCAIALGWVAWKLQQKDRERQAMADIRRQGGFANYQYGDRGKAPLGLGWTKWFLGDNFYDRVEDVGFDQDTKANIRPPKDLCDVKSLELTSAQVRDEDLYYVRHLSDLEIVWLTNNPVTDDGLLHLKGLVNLTLLHLGHSEVTGLGLDGWDGWGQIWYTRVSAAVTAATAA